MLGWVSCTQWAEAHHGVAGGFDFNDDRDGVWTEGTAQAALTYRAFGMSDKAQALLTEIAKTRHSSGYLYATRSEKLTTGLA